MKRFYIKFFLLFLAIDGFIGLYTYGIRPNLTGDMGKLGQIPFGQEYIKRIDAIYPHEQAMVQDISPEDSITTSVITIGDSFSQRGERGYSQFLAEMLHCNIQNIQHEQTPEQTLVPLLYHHKIPPQTTVILEVVERCIFWRLNSINFQDSTQAVCHLDELEDTPVQEQRNLKDALLFLKKAAGIKQPIFCYSTSKELFSHKKRHKKLYIYDSKWDKDGDLRFTELLNNEQLNNAYKNMYALHQLAEEHGVNLIYLIAADKYDVYEPFILSQHLQNPTLDHCPNEPWLINSKPLLQMQASAGIKDLYYINDSHWSPVGAKIVAEEIYKRLSF